MKPSWNVWRADYPLRPSRRLLGLVAGLHGLALLAIWQAYIPWPYALLASVLLLAAAAHYAWRWRWPGARQVVALAESTPAGSEGWWLQTGDGREHCAQLLPDTVVWRLMLVLRFRAAAGGVFHVVLLPDSLPPEGFRRLYVRLRLRRTPAEALCEEKT